MLSPRYIGPYGTLQNVGQVAYRFELPQELSSIHCVFHVSMLKKMIGDLSLIIPLRGIEINDNSTFEKVPISILDRQIRKLRNQEIASAKVVWQKQKVKEATWKAEEDMKKGYPILFVELVGHL